MANINASLKTTLNGAGPQHKVKNKAEFEFSEGTDNAIHHKLVDDDGNLFDLKNEISSIKNNQIKIKEQLERGSNIGVVLHDGVISAESYVDIDMNLLHPYFRLLILPNKETLVRVFEVWKDLDDKPINNLQSLYTSELKKHIITEKTESKTMKYRVRVYNDGLTNVVFKVHLLNLVN